MPTQQYIPPAGYSPLIKSNAMDTRGMHTSTSASNAYPPASGPTGSYIPSLPSDGVGFNRANSFPRGPATRQYNTTATSCSRAYDPVKDISGASGNSHCSARQYDISTYSSNRNGYGAIGTNQNFSQYREAIQSNNQYSTSQSNSSQHGAVQFNTSIISNQNNYGAIVPNRDADQYGSAPSQGQGFNASEPFNNGGNQASQVKNQQDYEAINNSFRKLTFSGKTPGADRPNKIRKVRRRPGAGRPRSGPKVTQKHESDAETSEETPSPELRIESPVWYAKLGAVQEPQEVKVAQPERHQHEQDPQLGEPRFHTTGIRAMKMLTRCFFDGPPTANPNATRHWTQFETVGLFPPTASLPPNDEAFYQRVEQNL